MYQITNFQELMVSLTKADNWKRKVEICDAISTGFIEIIAPEITAYYDTLKGNGDFWYPHDYRENSKDTENIITWSQWRKCQSILGNIMPSEITVLIDRLLQRAGYVHWHVWIERFPSDIEIAVILMHSQSTIDEKLDLLDNACSQAGSTRIRRSLFYHLVLAKDMKVEPFLNLTTRYKECLRPLVIDIICDFAFLSRYPASSLIYTGLIACFAEELTIKEVSERSYDKGTLFAWANFLRHGNGFKDDAYKDFRSAYIAWVSKELRYTFMTTPHGVYADNEWSFLEILCAIFVDDAAAISYIKELWIKKSETYYGWKKSNPASQWFAHIGLLLWGIGIAHLESKQDNSLLTYVIDRLNQYILSALSEDWYQGLLLQIFGFPYPDDTQVEIYLIALLEKIYGLELLCNIIQYYQNTTSANPIILNAMYNRLMLLSDFYKPQNKMLDEIDKIQENLEVALKNKDMDGA